MEPAVRRAVGFQFLAQNSTGLRENLASEVRPHIKSSDWILHAKPPTLRPQGEAEIER